MRYDLSKPVDYSAPDFSLDELVSLASANPPDLSAVFLGSDITVGGFNLLSDVVDLGNSKDWAKRGAELGDPLCMAKYGAILMVDNNKKVGAPYIENARPLLMQMAETGHVYAQTLMGMLCSRGFGCRVDQEAALDWYTKAAKQGEPNAAANIGLMCKEGVLIKRNIDEAEKWLKIAANKGHASAQFNLGGLYLLAGHTNLDLAVEYYTASAKQGNVKSARMLGETYATKFRISQDAADDARSFEWLKIAADKGDVQAAIDVAGRIVTERRADVTAIKQGATPEKTVTDVYSMSDAYVMYAQLLASPLDKRSKVVVEQRINVLKMSSTLETEGEKPVRRFPDGSGVAETIVSMGNPKPKTPRR